MNILEGLNKEQRSAVEYLDKSLLIVAGAGSGKTKTIVHKALYLIKEKGFSPSSILLVTFTNKAAKEIKDRIIKYLKDYKFDENITFPWVGTFHSIGAKIIRRYSSFFGLKKDFRVLDEEDSKKLFTELLRETTISKEEAKKLYKNVLLYIEDLEDFNKEEENSIKKIENQNVIDFGERFKNLMITQNAVNFSFLMGELKRKLLEEEKLRDKVRAMFDYAIVDEFQDTNKTQYEILKLIAPKNATTVIGDPNQCIYEWRQAHPTNIISFLEDFEPNVITLNINYRSTSSILKFANSILSSSKASWKDLIPTLVSDKQEESSKKPILLSFTSDEKEAEFIAQKILELKDREDISSIGILVRATFITDQIERALTKKGIPYYIVGTVKFFERKEIKDILSYLYFALNENDFISFERSITNPKRKVGKKTIEDIKRLAEQKNITLYEALKLYLSSSLTVKTTYIEPIKDLKEKIKSNFPIYKALEELIDKINYKNYLKEEFPTEKEYQEKLENIEELIRFFKIKEEDKSLSDILSEISLYTDEDNNLESSTKVKIMTIHASKGLEFDVVFLPRVEDGILPHKLSFDSDQRIEEERRLFYVASTRAKKLIILSFTKAGQPSRFLKEIDISLIDNKSVFTKVEKREKTYIETPFYKKEKKKNFYSFQVGQIVSHSIFGKGVIKKLSDNKALVLFEAGEKEVITDFLEPYEN